MKLKQRCTKCGARKEFNQFDKKMGGKNGLNAQCRPCKSDAKTRSRMNKKDDSNKSTWLNGSDEIFCTILLMYSGFIF